MEIELEVLWHTDKSRELDKLDLDFSEVDLDKRLITFYSIDVISPNLGFPPYEFTNIHSSGDKWICTMPYRKLKEKIKSK